ncbi:MAG: type II toxin-antitoxin system RelB/DinJ family antitoxin [Lachnospiraceae bacterium]|nr:type II toxin-antitoxin system RelB/DinJ family antitoxin [Lachnospiraceae bacterium]
MATSLLQVRIDDSLKDEAAQVFERLGIDTSTAVRMFLKRAILENGIPFKMTLPKAPYNAERGYRAMVEIGEASEKNGLADMSLEEINAEIEASRNARQASAQ